MRDGVEILRGCSPAASGAELSWTVLLVQPHIRPRLSLDARFSNLGIVRGGRLLDIAATQAQWGAPPGRLPEDWLAAESPGTIGFCPTNWGWQYGAWLVQENRLRGLPGDVPSGNPLWMLCWAPEKGWYESSMRIGPEFETPLLGLEMPQILRSGLSMPLASLLDHDRLLSDLRNVFDFADGRGSGLDPEFWVRLRRVLPGESTEARALLEGRQVRIELDRGGGDDRELRSMVEQADLPGVQVVEGALIFSGPLPKARLPLFAIGAQERGTLVVVAIDGRQTGRPGATITEAADLLREHGACTGGLGSAGGDVCLVERTASGMRYLNEPSTRSSATGAGTSRPVPSLVLI